MTIFDDGTPFDEIGSPFDRVAASSLNSLTGRISADPESVERGLVQLVLTLVELIRQLMERRAVRRLDAGARSGSVAQPPRSGCLRGALVPPKHPRAATPQPGAG